MDNFGPFPQNNTQYGYNQNGYNMPVQPYSNILLVTSLEEAIMKTTRLGSDMVYFNQNGGEFYRVRLEMNGAKYHQTFPYFMPEQSNNTPLMKSDLEPILLRLDTLEKKFGTEVVSNEQSS